MRSLGLVPFFLLCSLSFARPSPRSNHVVHEKRAMEPRGWVQTRRLEADKVLPMRFGMTQNNLHKLEEMLMAVSHPDSPAYGQHYSPLEVVNTFAPSAETISAVSAWLAEFGFSKDRLRLTGNKGWVEVNATVAEVEELLHTEYHVFTHPSGVEQISRVFLKNFSGPRGTHEVDRLSFLLRSRARSRTHRPHQTNCTLYSRPPSRS